MDGRRNQFVAKGGESVVVQSCEMTWAHIGIFSGWRSAYYHVAIPDFTRQYRRVYPAELSADQFDRVLAENREAVLALVQRLCEEVQHE